MSSKPLWQNKAQMFAHKIMFYVAVLFVLTILLTLLMYLVVSISNLSLATPKDLGNFIMTERFINSPQCFAYTSDQFTYRLSVVDASKFTQGVMDGCYPADFKTKGKSIRIILQDAKGSQIAALTSKNWRGSAASKRTKEVSIYMSGYFVDGKLQFEIEQ
ncbi:hypothetical protein HYV81_03780 [Candidatus Woesearchaeota archaeon]|nr:hypothetical protein [Candidatus Woesearchaeota archaeon]